MQCAKCYIKSAHYLKSLQEMKQNWKVIKLRGKFGEKMKDSKAELL